MATASFSVVVPLHQPKRPLSAAERAKAYRDRKAARIAGKPAAVTIGRSHLLISEGRRGDKTVEQRNSTATQTVAPHLVPADRQPLLFTAPIVEVAAPADLAALPAVTPPARVTPDSVTPDSVTPPARVTSHRFSQWLLIGTAMGLGLVGMAVNGAFARSLGSSEMAGWLFLATGVAADAIAMAMPSAAAAAWQAHQRFAALAGWVIWTVAFAFVLSAGIGFASLNVTDVTMSRASRVTPAVETAKASLTDAMSSRDRECQTGTGKTCRVREEAVVERRRTLDTAMATVAQAADPQTEAAARMIGWLSGGVLKPASDDIGMLRLILLALLPQLGGLVLMVGRAGR